MATEVGSLLIKVQADVAQISSDLEKIKGRVGNFARTTKQQLSPVTSAFDGLSKKIFTVVTAYASLRTVTAVMSGFRNLVETETRLESFATRLGIATETLREFQYIAERSGTPAESFNSSLEKMMRQISEAASGLGRAKKEISELGIDAKKLEEAGPERAFLAVVDALQDIPNKADQVRIAMHLFDADMLDIVTGGSAGIEQLRGKFRELAGVTDNELTKNMKLAKEAGVDLKTAWSALMRSMTDTPNISKATNWLTEMIVHTRELREEAFKTKREYKDIFEFLHYMAMLHGAKDTWPTGPRGWALNERRIREQYVYNETGFVGPPPPMPKDPRAGLYAETPSQAMQRQLAAMKVTGSGLRYAGGKELAGLEPKTAAYDLSDFKDYYQGVDAELKRNGQQMADYWDNHLTTMEQVAVNVAGGIADSFGTMFSAVIDGTMSMKEAFANFGQAVIANIAQIIAKMIAMYAIEQVIMAAAGVFGFKPDKILRGIGIKHIGGLITEADMPRYHMGGMIRPLGQDEVPIIAQAGERILPRGASGGSQTPKVEINLHNEGEALNPTKKSMRMDEGKLVVDLWLERMNSSPSERRRARRSLA